MLYWIDFLHIYQPPNQDPAILDQVTKESYLHIIKLLKKYPRLKFTLNISGTLQEQLNHNGYLKVITEIKTLVKKGKIELVGSAMYHPILPLLPRSEIKRQIQLHNEISLERFGKNYKPKGFYLPEMAYSKKVADVIKEMGFKWIILDEIHFPGKEVNNNTKYKIKNNGLFVVFRNRNLSKSFPPEVIFKNLEKLNQKSKQNNYVITAHDGELYGHWHKEDVGGYYRKSFTSRKIQNITVSEYLKSIRKTKEITLKNANWESTPAELNSKIPYALWDDPKNKIHQLLWELRELAIKAIRGNENDPQYIWSRNHLDRGLASCSWWWAAERRPDVFSPITWNPTEIEKGLKELISSIRSLQNIKPEVKLKAEKIYLALVKNIWQKHWKKYA